MINLGTVRPGSTIYIPFESFATSTGAPITITGLATSDILVYKDGSTTQRASAAGFTLLDTDGIDFDAITGIHGFSIDLSDNTTADFWAAGSRYFVVVSTVTVDSQTMSFIAATFDIGYPSATLNTTIATLASQTSFTLTSGPAEDDALNGRWAVIHDAASAVQSTWVQVLDYTGATKTVTLVAGGTFTVAAKDNFSLMDVQPLMPTTTGRTLDVSAGGEAGLDWANVGSPTTTVGLSGTTVKTATDVETDTQDIQSRLPAALTAGGNIKADALALSGDTVAADNAESFFDGTGYAGTNNVIPLVTTTTTATNVTTVNGLAAGVITASSIAADAITAAKVADGTIDSATFAAGAINAAAIADGAIDRATFAADTGLQSARSNTAQAGAAGTITLDASASATTDFYVGMWIYLTGGTGVGQARVCTAYNGTTKVATIAPNWATNPDVTSTFAVLSAAQITGVQGNLTGSAGSVTGNVGGNVTGSVGSVAAGGITAASIATGAIDADALATDAVTEILTAISGMDVDGATTFVQALRLLCSALGGKSSGLGGSVGTFRNIPDTKDVIVSTIDASGNRGPVTLDLT